MGVKEKAGSRMVARWGPRRDRALPTAVEKAEVGGSRVVIDAKFEVPIEQAEV